MYKKRPHVQIPGPEIPSRLLLRREERDRSRIPVRGRLHLRPVLRNQASLAHLLLLSGPRLRVPLHVLRGPRQLRPLLDHHPQIQLPELWHRISTHRFSEPCAHSSHIFVRAHGAKDLLQRVQANESGMGNLVIGN